MSLTQIGKYLHPVGSERSFWTAFATLFEDGNLLDFDEWDSVFELARLKGLTAHDGHGNFANPLGYALYKRWLWAKDARARNLTPHQAERELQEQIDAYNARYDRRGAGQARARRSGSYRTGESDV